jgi:hypothetical protein
MDDASMKALPAKPGGGMIPFPYPASAHAPLGSTISILAPNADDSSLREAGHESPLREGADHAAMEQIGSAVRMMDGEAEFVSLTEVPPVTGSRITEAVVREMTEGGEPLSKAILVPSVFRIYVHPRDWDRLYPILHELRADVESELEAALARLNKRLRSLPVRYGFMKAKEYRRVKDYWQVDLYPNRDEDCPAGEFLIVSDFPEPPRAVELEGGETVRATRYATAGSTAGERLDRARRAETVFAQIWFTDDLGRRSYLMTRNEVHIGRGGVGRWVDLEIRSELPDISREHAIIRRTANGGFEIKDVSKFGTTVNGTAVPQSKAVENSAEEADKSVWAPLTVPARIVLAGKFELDFQPVGSTPR